MEAARFRRTGIWLLCALIGATALLYALGFAADRVLSPACDNAVLSSSPSPDGRHKLVIFERSCGAASDFSTQVSLLAAGAELGHDGGNALVVDTDHGRAPAGPGGGPEVHVRWNGAGVAVLSVHPAARVFKFESRVEGGQLRLARSM